MKWLTVALLLFSVLAPTVFAQDQSEDPSRAFSRWIETVTAAERDYKNKNDRYGDLAALRKAHFLDRLVFESDSSSGASGRVDANFVPKHTLFQVTVSADGHHFRAVIGVNCTSTMVEVDDRGNPRYGMERISCPPVRLPLVDSPEGPTISVAR